jgi:hypothetical protein
MATSSPTSILSSFKESDERGDGGAQSGDPYSSLLSTHSRSPPTSSAHDTLFFLFSEKDLLESLLLFAFLFLQVFATHEKQRRETASGCSFPPQHRVLQIRSD